MRASSKSGLNPVASRATLLMCRQKKEKRNTCPRCWERLSSAFTIEGQRRVGSTWGCCVRRRSYATTANGGDGAGARYARKDLHQHPAVTA